MSEPAVQTPSSTEIHVLGQRLVLRSDRDPRELRAIVDLVQRRVSELGSHGTISTTKLAILAAINLADDYLRAVEEGRALREAVAQQTRALLETLDVLDDADARVP